MTTRELSKISGISIATLQKWDESGMVKCDYAHAGRRDWSVEQSLRVLALSKLRAKGFRGKSLRRIADMMPLSLSEHRFLVTDGRLVHLCLLEAEAVSWMESVGGPVALEALSPLVHAVHLAQPKPLGNLA